MTNTTTKKTVKQGWRNPKRSRLVQGTEGKVIVLMGSNSTGKTFQATKPDSSGKEVYLFAYEEGLGALDGVAFLPVEKWYDGIKELRDIKKNIEDFKENYSAIVIDEIYTASIMCQEYISSNKGVATIKEGNSGYGLWKEYELEFLEFVMDLKKLGITIFFIIHTQPKVIGQDSNENDIVKQLPKGDWRSVNPVIDNSDLVLYLEANGVDENGNVILSSAYSAETNKAFARSRFDFFPTYMPEFTKENLEAALTRAVELKAKSSGSQTITQAERDELYSMPKQDFRHVLNKTINLARQLCLIFGEQKVESQQGILQDIIEKVFGNGVTIQDVGNMGVDKLDLVEELGYQIEKQIGFDNRTLDLRKDTEIFLANYQEENPDATQEEIESAVDAYVASVQDSWVVSDEEKSLMAQQ